MSDDQLREVIHSHRLWLNGQATAQDIGKRACFRGVDLAWCDFSGTDMRRADFRNSNLLAANFNNANLRGANFRGANLVRAAFYNANLRNADFRGACLGRRYIECVNFHGAKLEGVVMDGVAVNTVPVVADLDQKILSAISNGQPRLGVSLLPSLEMQNWHTCDTTHCRAGWAVVLAGDAGRELEASYGCNMAGALIYHASTGRVPNFYVGNNKALKDLQEQAAKGRAAVE